MKNPLCVLAGITPFTHRNKHSDARPFCALVVVVPQDYAEPRVILVDETKQTLEEVMAQEYQRRLIDRAA